MKVVASGDVDQSPSVDVYGALLGTESDATALFDELAVRVGSEPTSASCKHMSFPETRRFWAQLGAAEEKVGEGSPEVVQQPYLLCKSEFFKRPLPTEAIVGLVETFSQGRTSGESRELDFMPWGGAYNRVKPEATAFVHRLELFQLKHAVVADASASTSEKEAAYRQVRRSWASVHRWGSGRVFQNFSDPDLEQWADAYYGTNLDRLMRIKARYDEVGFFRTPQSLRMH